MDSFKNINEFIANQKAELEKLETEFKKITNENIVAENKNLKLQNETLNIHLEKNLIENKNLKSENLKLKENIFAESSKDKIKNLNIFMSSSQLKYKNIELQHNFKLKELETIYKKRILEIEESIKKNSLQDNEQLNNMLHSLNENLNEIINTRKNDFENIKNNDLKILNDDLEKINQIPISQEEIENKINKNNFELKLGTKYTNIVGIILVLLGVIFGLQYTYENILKSNELKSIAGYILGVVILFGGEFLNKKQKRKSIFSIGITSLGIGILFAVTSISYFNLGVLSMLIALFICILITSVSFILSLKYNSETIANFALVGGYLPFLLVNDNNQIFLLGSIIYLLLLNIFTLIISLKKDWKSIKYISFLFGAVSIFLFLSRNPNSILFSLILVMGIFILYLLTVLVNPLILKIKSNLNISVYVMLSINTILNSIFIFRILYNNNLGDFFSITALIISIFYFSLGQFFNKKLNDKVITHIFFLSSFIFSVLVVPLQFSNEFIGLIWTLQGILLILLGIRYNNKFIKTIGTSLYIIIFINFLFFELTYFQLSDDFLYIRLLTYIVGLVLFFLYEIYQNKNNSLYFNSKNEKWFRFIKISTITLIYSFLNITSFKISNTFYRINNNFIYDYEVAFLFFIIFKVCFSIFIQKFKYIQGMSKKLFPFLNYIIVILFVFIFNIFYDSDVLLISIGCNIFAILSFWNLSKSIKNKFNLFDSFEVLSTSIITIIFIIQNMLHFVSFNNMLISFVLIIFAFVLILYGFIKNLNHPRRFGLVLEILSIFKFFIIDLFFLKIGEKIIAYFVLGLVLIGISYLYQYFSNKLFSENSNLDNLDEEEKNIEL